MRKNILLITMLAAGALLTYNLWTSPAAPTTEKEEKENHEEFVKLTDEQLKQHNIETDAASSGNLEYIVKAPAKITIISDKLVHILPKTSGIAITAYKNLGESVEEGELLATIESKEIAEVKSQYLTAFKKAKLNDNIYQREASLYEKKISATQDFLNAENTWQESLIDLEMTRQRLHTLGMTDKDIDNLPQTSPNELRVYEVRSPIAGRIIDRHITPGELIANDHEIYVIADLSTVWAEINIFSQDRQYIQKGQKVNLSTHDGSAAKATVVYLSPIIDEDTRTSTALAEINNSNGEWLPGAFAQAELITEIVPVSLVVPKDAVQNIDGEDSIFVVTEEGFAARPIKMGRSDEKQCEVLSGLKDGEVYACKNTFLLKAELKKDEAEMD